MTELSYYASGNIQEWRDGDKKCSEECVLPAGGFRFVPLPLFTMGRTVENFLASCENEKKFLQVIIENDLGKEPWNEIFLNAKKKTDAVRALAGNVVMRRRLKQRFWLFVALGKYLQENLYLSRTDTRYW